jgi:hypothetical protein
MADANYDGQAKVYRTQGATAMVVASGGRITVEPGGAIAGLTVEIPLGAHLFGARELSSGENFASGTSAAAMYWGGFLDKDTTPNLGIVSTADQTPYVQWASANVDGIRFPPVTLPQHVSSADGLTVEVYGESIGTGTASDAIAAVKINVWNGVGGANLGATHADFTSSPSWKTVSIASGSVVPNVPFNISLVPQAHAGRALRIYDARIRGKRSS